VNRGLRATLGNNTEVKLNAKAYALRLIELRPRTVWELKDKLARKAVDKREIKSLTAELEAVGLLNDEKYARDWIENRQHFRPTGIIRLRQELLAKRVDREVVDRAIAEYKETANEFPAALDLARRKMKLYRKLDKEAVKRRLAGFLARRGYGPDIVSKVLKKLRNEMIPE
jgi:regulatory protein